MSSLEERLSRANHCRNHGPVAEELPDGTTLMMEVLFDIRRNTDVIPRPALGGRWRRGNGRQLKSAQLERLAEPISTAGCRKQSRVARPRRGARPTRASAETGARARKAW